MIAIRPALPGDAERMLEILQENKQTLDGVDYGSWTSYTLVLLREGAVEGLIQALPGAPYAVVTELAISREHHGKGYGIKLANAMELLLRTTGVTSYVTYAATKHGEMRDMLTRYGFQETGHGTGYVRRLG